MGGHGGLNILPQKSWNVYNRDNRAKVAKDEAKHEQEEKRKQLVLVRAEAESRVNVLRERVKKRKVEYVSGGVQEGSIQDEDVEQGPAPEAPLVHINLFQDIEDRQVKNLSQGNPEYEADKRKEDDKELRLMTTYLGQSVLDAKGNLPWYMNAHSFVRTTIQAEPACSFPLPPANFIPTRTVTVAGTHEKEDTDKATHEEKKHHKKDRKEKKEKKHKKHKKDKKEKKDKEEVSKKDSEPAITAEQSKQMLLDKLRKERLERERIESIKAAKLTTVESTPKRQRPEDDERRAHPVYTSGFQRYTTSTTSTTSTPHITHTTHTSTWQNRQNRQDGQDYHNNAQRPQYRTDTDKHSSYTYKDTDNRSRGRNDSYSRRNGNRWETVQR